MITYLWPYTSKGWNVFFFFFVGDALYNQVNSRSRAGRSTDQVSFTENDNETITLILDYVDYVTENGAENTLNTDVVEDAKQIHSHHEEDISDDFIRDPDYTPSCDESSAPENEESLTMVATTPEQLDEDVALNKMVKRKRNKCLSMGTWKQNESKEKRLKGISYNSKGGKEISAKAMGPPCNSKFCQRVSTRDCQVITEEQ